MRLPMEFCESIDVLKSWWLMNALISAGSTCDVPLPASSLLFLDTLMIIFGISRGLVDFYGVSNFL
jgi:hypothetical protein